MAPEPFTVIPAIDLRGGRVVRLYQGDYTRQTDYPVDPVELAASYARAGATWLHVVNLDGAREGGLDNLHALAAMVRLGLRVQAGGGVRHEADVERLLAAGVARVVVGSMAVREPDRVTGWLRRFGAGHVTLALDARWHLGAWRLPCAGWTEDVEATLETLAPHYAACGARHLLCTDIDRDGTLAGPNLSLYAYLSGRVPTLAVQASGGVRTVDDVCRARDAGAAAVILGRALLDQHFTLDQALAAVAPC